MKSLRAALEHPRCIVSVMGAMLGKTLIRTDMKLHPSRMKSRNPPSAQRSSDGGLPGRAESFVGLLFDR